MTEEAVTAEQREADVQKLAAFAEAAAKPVAGLAAVMSDNLAGLWLILRALDLACRDFGGEAAVKDDRRADFDRAVRLAADRIVASWRDAEAGLEFRDALAAATQPGGAA
jgi:hypothetical protein